MDNREMSLAAPAHGADDAGQAVEQRRRRSFEVRVHAAENALFRPCPAQRPSGDEKRYPGKVATFTKGLPHNDRGEVDPRAWDLLIAALRSGRQHDFDAIPLGGVRKLGNPRAGLAFDLQGADPHQLALPPAPTLASAEAAAEVVELYWMALARDVPFFRYGSDATIAAAAAELDRLGGPRAGGRITADTIFRGPSPGDLSGPFISQLLYRDVPWGAQRLVQRQRTRARRAPIGDFLVGEEEWLAVQCGMAPPRRSEDEFDRTPRYIRNARDLACYVEVDQLHQAYLNAALILLAPRSAGGLGAPPNPGNPYVDKRRRTESGFGTFGAPHVLALVAEVAARALKAVWYQKWFVHRRLRPETFGGRVHFQKERGLDYGLHRDLVASRAVAEVRARTGTYLLPQAYPGGAPLHPSYGSGHAAVAGACVTVLKAMFDEDAPIDEVLVPDPDSGGTALVRSAGGGSLAVRGELEKLASNVALGRCQAGVGYRSDVAAALRLGEQVAITLLEEQERTFHEPSVRYTFTPFFSNEKITI